MEAAFAVPLFFLAVASLICMMEIYAMYAEKTVDLQEKAETAAAYVSLAGNYAPPAIDLTDQFEYHPKWYPEALPGVTMTVRGRVLPWVGRKSSNEPSTQGFTSDELVYVTNYESVYHTTSQCTHLALSVQSVSGSSVWHLRNSGGETYHACEKCVGSGGKNSTVYITKEGNRYHNSAECSGLKRTTKLVRKSETAGLHICSRCSAHEASGAA
ncbi:MAG: hypothetical protein HUJ73_05460 [Eubacterium sp.]|nr:hypothetical protein [Eubacterium sp.]